MLAEEEPLEEDAELEPLEVLVEVDVDVDDDVEVEVEVEEELDALEVDSDFDSALEALVAELASLEYSADEAVLDCSVEEDKLSCEEALDLLSEDFALEAALLEDLPVEALDSLEMAEEAWLEEASEDSVCCSPAQEQLQLCMAKVDKAKRIRRVDTFMVIPPREFFSLKRITLS